MLKTQMLTSMLCTEALLWGQVHLVTPGPEEVIWLFQSVAEDFFSLMAWWFIGWILGNTFFFPKKFFFNWRIIALQCRVRFCHTIMWISHKYIYAHSLLNLHSTSLDCQRAWGWAPCVIQQLPTSCFMYGRLYISMLLHMFQFIQPSPSPAVTVTNLMFYP